jgi:hypothetical protein
MATEPTIADACRVQRDLGLLDVHVAYVDLDTDWFVLAHTTAERLAARPVPAREFLVVPVPDPVPLTDCAFHVYLAVGNLDGRLCCTGSVLPGCPRFVFAQTGWYVLPTSSLHDVHGLAL